MYTSTCLRPLAMICGEILIIMCDRRRYYSNLCLNSTVQGASTLACGVLYLAQAMAEIFQPSAGLPSSTEGIPTVTPSPAAAMSSSSSSSSGPAAASTEPLMSPLTARGGALSWPWWHAFQVNQRVRLPPSRLFFFFCGIL